MTSILAQIDRELQITTTSVAIGICIVCDAVTKERSREIRESLERWMFDFNHEDWYDTRIPFEILEYMNYYGQCLETIIDWLNFINPATSHDDKAKPVSMFLESPTEAFSTLTLGDLTRFFVQDIGMLYFRGAYNQVKSAMSRHNVTAQEMLDKMGDTADVVNGLRMSFYPTVSLADYKKGVISMPIIKRD